ncbi:MAG: autotransporter-associated beta strand repeat-containing protein, partial [Kiritimatiellia bacterium]
MECRRGEHPGVTVVVDSGSQLFPNTTASTFGAVRIIGIGNNEARGAIRMTTNLAAPVTLMGDATIGAEGVLTPAISTGVAGTSTLTLGTANSNNVPVNMLNGVISNGTGTLALAVFNQNLGNIFISGASLNTYSGGTTLLNSASGTRLVIGTITGTPYGTGAITIGQAATDKAGIYFSTANQTLANGIVFNTALGTDRAGVRSDFTGIVISGPITANLAPATFSTNGTGAIRLTGQITGAQGLTLDNTFGTTITVTLANAAANNSYAGNTNIAGAKGVLTLGVANQIPNGAAAGNLVNNGTFNLGGFSEQINGLSGNGTIDGVSGTPTLTFGDNNATGDTFSGVIKNTAGTLNLTKIGTGSETLGGNNTYTGATRILAGTLNVTGGTLNGTTQVVVGGTGGTGTPVFNLSGGAVTASGGSST